MTDLVGETLGGQFLYVDRSIHSRRIIDIVGPDWVRYVEDFVKGPALDAAMDNEFTVTRVEAGAGESTLTRVDGVGGIGRITTDANENDGVNAQLIGESFQLTAANRLYFGAFGVKVSAAVESDLFLGLAITDTDILGGVTDRIGFQSIDGAADLKFAVEKDTVETLSASLHTLVDATEVDLEFFWDGPAGKLEVFINGVSVATPAITNVPDDEALRVSWQFLAGAVGAKTCDVDTIRVFQLGR